MAYSLYEEAQLNSPKSVQYYPEEYDYPSYYHKISEVKVNPDHSPRKPKNSTPSVNYINERKCPIYVHQYHKVQNASTYNNYSSKTSTRLPTERGPPKPKKIPGFPTTKSVLDQLEETYWATWKPNKEIVGAMSKKTKAPDNRISKIKAYGDVPDNLPGYFSSSEFETSAVSAVEESDYEKFKNYETVINMQDLYETRLTPVRLKTTHTQEIQTDTVPLTLPKIEEHIESDETKKQEEQPEVKEEPAEKKPEGEGIPKEKSSDEEPEEGTNNEKSKFLKHTDSFIINKKKQSEVKEHFQQPKCIRLYRKPGTSSSFIRGGSYPLKSCLKRESTPKGNFKLGAPGSPLFVSTSSFHKKTRK